MSSFLLNITVDCAHPERVARFWAAVTGWQATREWGGEHGDEYAVTPATGRPRLYFVPVPEPKAAKNRVHLDIVPEDRGQNEEIARLTAIGASIVSDRRPDVGWVIMSDPEGNEFCIEPDGAHPAT